MDYFLGAIEPKFFDNEPGPTTLPQPFSKTPAPAFMVIVFFETAAYGCQLS